jgi:hydrogenase maturation protease
LTMRTLILGIGSSILTDDTVGIVVARKLEEKLSDRDDIDVAINEEAGFSLLEDAIGYDRLVVIDSILTGAEPGTLMRFDLESLGPTIHSSSPHGLNLATVMEFGRRQGLNVPDDVIIYAVEIRDALTFSEELTSAVAASVDDVVERIANELS